MKARNRISFPTWAIYAITAAAIVLFCNPVGADLSKEDQKCVDAINKGAWKVSKTQGKENAKCIKDGGKGKLTTTIEECLLSDRKGKVAKMISKIQTEKCPSPPAFPPLLLDKNEIGDLMIGKELSLIHSVFGSDLDVVMVNKDDDKDGWKCQASIAKDVAKCQDTKLKEFRSCKKNALKGKNGLPVQNLGELQDRCMNDIVTGGIPDDKGKIAKKCVAGLDKTISKKCAVSNVDALIPGCAGQSLQPCLDQKVECEVCKALNALDGLARNCDEFDDGSINGSCETAPFIGAHKCVMDSPASSILIQTQALPLPPFNPVGAVDIDCGTVDPITGKAPCTCELQDLVPIEIVGIGFVCFTQGSAGCDVGEIDCDGGNALDVTMDSDHNIGACTGNPDCAGQCAAYCAPDSVFNSGCEGFCDGGVRNGLPCAADSECPGGSCPGKDGLPHGNICGCDCLAIGGAPSGPGAMQCNLDVNIDVETAGPCGDGDVLIAVGERCIPLTTEALSSQLHNANATPFKDFPVPPEIDSGARIDCDDLASSATTGLRLVGTVNFFDSTIGDLNTMEAFTCQ